TEKNWARRFTRRFVCEGGPGALRPAFVRITPLLAAQPAAAFLLLLRLKWAVFRLVLLSGQKWCRR
ncbi:MAG: hypothetical protein MPK05_00240, partial [Gammaproteobacteria bacterium]|nr:hypothetical protein [Gammaproteobacteria bacterium]